MPFYDPTSARDRAHGEAAVRILCSLCQSKPELLAFSGVGEWYHEHKKIDREDHPRRIPR